MTTLPPTTHQAPARHNDPPTTTFALTISVCDECRTTVPDHAAACPECRQSTGPFTRLVAWTRVIEDTHGQPWLCLFHQNGTAVTPRAARPLTTEEARWLTRQPHHIDQEETAA